MFFPRVTPPNVAHLEYMDISGITHERTKAGDEVKAEITLSGVRVSLYRFSYLIALNYLLLIDGLPMLDS